MSLLWKFFFEYSDDGSDDDLDTAVALMIAHVESNKQPNYGGGIWYGRAQDGTSGQAASRP